MLLPLSETMQGFECILEGNWRTAKLVIEEVYFRCSGLVQNLTGNVGYVYLAFHSHLPVRKGDIDSLGKVMSDNAPLAVINEGVHGPSDERNLIASEIGNAGLRIVQRSKNDDVWNTAALQCA